MTADIAPEIAPVRPGEQLDWGRLQAWLRPRLAEALPGVDGPLTALQFPNGSANLTYLLRLGEHELVLRRPPMGELAPGAHDMRREFTVISALWPTAVPVPEPLAYTDDEAVTGAQFYAMGWVEGRSLYTAAETAEHLPSEAARARTGPSFIDVLAALHSLDPDDVGLGGLGKRTSYVGRQLHRWFESWNASKNREMPDVDRLYTFLVERLPTTLEWLLG